MATKANKWQGRDVSRWVSKEYDDIYNQAEQELDPVKRAAMYIKMNDMVVGDNYIQPVVYRPRVTASRGQSGRLHQRLGQRPLATRELVPRRLRA